jgi:septal ring factor EnvC (AmiA/AmiB activator)
MQERMEGLQGWMAEIERKQGRMTYFGAAAAGLAVLAAAAALYLGITTKNDAATKDDVDAVSQDLGDVQQEVKRAVEKELKTTNDQIATLKQASDDLRQKQAQDAEDIATLQSQSTTRNGAGAGTGLGGTGAGKP